MTDEDGDLAARLGHLLRVERELARLTQAALAERAGMRQQHVARFETGRSAPTTRVVHRLFAALGLQLRLAVEPLDAQVDAGLVEAAGQSDEDVAQILEDFQALRRWAGDVAFVLDGEIAARLQGVPLPARSRFAVAVADADLGRLADWITTIPNCRRYSERWRDFSEFDVDPRRAGPLRWWTPFGELSARLVPELPAPVMVAVGERRWPVRPLAQVEGDDPVVARVLRRLRAASGRRSA